MTTLREAAEIGLSYIETAIVVHDQGYGDHPSMRGAKDAATLEKYYQSALKRATPEQAKEINDFYNTIKG